MFVPVVVVELLVELLVVISGPAPSSVSSSVSVSVSVLVELLFPLLFCLLEMALSRVVLFSFGATGTSTTSGLGARANRNRVRFIFRRVIVELLLLLSSSVVFSVSVVSVLPVVWEDCGAEEVDDDDVVGCFRMPSAPTGSVISIIKGWSLSSPSSVLRLASGLATSVKARS